MKRFLMFFAFCTTCIMVFCQTPPGDSFKDALVSLGISPALALMISAGAMIVLGQIIPQKWTAPLIWLEKVFYAITAGLHALNERTNRLSKNQRAVKQQAEGAKKHDTALLAKAKAAGMTLILLLTVTFANAQSPWSGFFKPVTTDAVYSQLSVKGTDDATSGSVWLFRPSATLTAMAIDFSEKPALSKSLSSVGFGLSYGKFTTIDDKAYCTWSANALLLTSIKLGEVESTALGAALTVDVFNKFIGAGVGYLDKSFMFLTTISVSF
jgi:hypothetical protein